MADPVTSIAATAVESATGGFLSSIGLYIALALIVVAFGGGWYAHGVWFNARQEAVLQSELDKRVAAENKFNLADQQNQRLQALLDTKNKQLNTKVSDEVQKPAYRCTLPAAAVSLLNSN